jgi:hypothetical protein
MLPPWGTTVGIWPHLTGQPHPYCPPWGTVTDVYFSNFLLVFLFFENQRKNIKNPFF